MHTSNSKQSLPLIILDMDECLLHASAIPIKEIAADYKYQALYVYFRPGVAQFLAQAAQCYQLAIWSTGTDAYVQALIAAVTPPNIHYAFVWGRSKCRKVKDDFFGYTHYYKSIDKLKRYGFSLESIIMIDDTPAKIITNYAQVVEISAFKGEGDDNALSALLADLIH